MECMGFIFPSIKKKCYLFDIELMKIEYLFYPLEFFFPFSIAFLGDKATS